MCRLLSYVVACCILISFDCKSQKTRQNLDQKQEIKFVCPYAVHERTGTYLFSVTSMKAIAPLYLYYWFWVGVVRCMYANNTDKHISVLYVSLELFSFCMSCILVRKTDDRLLLGPTLSISDIQDICSRFREDCMPSPALQTALHVLTIVGVVLSLIGIVLTVFTLLVFKWVSSELNTITQNCFNIPCMPCHTLLIFHYTGNFGNPPYFTSSSA